MRVKKGKRLSILSLFLLGIGMMMFGQNSSDSIFLPTDRSAEMNLIYQNTTHPTAYPESTVYYNYCTMQPKGWPAAIPFLKVKMHSGQEYLLIDSHDYQYPSSSNIEMKDSLLRLLEKTASEQEHTNMQQMLTSNSQVLENKHPFIQAFYNYTRLGEPVLTSEGAPCNVEATYLLFMMTDCYQYLEPLVDIIVQNNRISIDQMYIRFCILWAAGHEDDATRYLLRRLNSTSAQYDFMFQQRYAELKENSDMQLLIARNDLLKAKAAENESKARNLLLQKEHEKSQSILHLSKMHEQQLILDKKQIQLASENNLLQLDKQRQSIRLRREEEKLHELELEKANNEKKASERFTITTLIVASTTIGLLICWLLYQTKARNKIVHVNKELTGALDKAKMADRMKTAFIQNMSHEIRTPLNAIVGFSSLLADEYNEINPEEAKEFSNLINKNSDLLTTLVNDILDLSNLESGKYQMQFSPYSVQTLCNDTIDCIKQRVPEGVELKVDYDEDIQLVMDNKRVEQILINYLTNACKHTEKGSITLSYKIMNNYVEFAVTDTGDGIPKDKAESVFQRFEKLNQFKQGTGLGLNICRAIASQLQSRCWVDTGYTDGARVIFELNRFLKKTS